jgi:hypothetical protein
MKICSVKGCDKIHKALSFCGMHYFRWHRHKDINYQRQPPKIKESLLERLMKYTEISVDPNDCWIWTGTKDSGGYGRIKVSTGKSDSAHRVSYQIHNNKLIPIDMHCCHSCDRPDCINPSHLWIGTRSDNMQDKIKKGRCYDYKGRNNPRVKLTEKNVIDIKKRLSLGDNHTNIAKNFNVSKSHITNINIGNSWKHVHA